MQHGGKTEDWQPVCFDKENPDSNDPDTHQLLWQLQIVEAASQLLGTPPRVHYGMLAMVPPPGGNGLPWHQDAQYNHILGGALNVFITLNRITPEMANLWIAPRSHAMGLQPSQINQTNSAAILYADSKSRFGFATMVVCVGARVVGIAPPHDAARMCSVVFADSCVGILAWRIAN